jgi:hypothetical protein
MSTDDGGAAERSQNSLDTMLQSSLSPLAAAQVAEFVAAVFESHPILHAQMLVTHQMGYQSTLVATIATDGDSVLSWYIMNDTVRAHTSALIDGRKPVALVVRFPGDTTHMNVFTVPMTHLFFVETVEDLRAKFKEIETDHELMAEAMKVVMHNLDLTDSK